MKAGKARGQGLLMAPETEAVLRQRYRHHSHHYTAIGPIYPHQPAAYGRRAVHPNPGVG